MKKLLFVPFIIGLLLFLSTCRKTEENNFLKGTWQINSMKINKDTADPFILFFPNYNPAIGDYQYSLNFAENDVVIASYVINDTLYYTKEGEWQLNSTKEMHLVLDNFINGTFTLDKLDSENYNLTSDQDSNYIESLDTVVRLTIKLNRLPAN
ncbi:MAG: hypothetical protein K1X82_03345 [Bacteroidia bacterium]|nr:hypothetical protein [Bacteroidia bacterium]